MEPGQRAFDDPAGPAQATAVGRPSLRKLRRDAAGLELVAMGLGIVAAVALDEVRLCGGAPRTAAQCRKRVDQGQELRDVVAIRGGQERDERNPVRVSENMMLRPGLAAIGRVRSSFFPPRKARSDELSTTARARSSWPRRRNSVSSAACRRFQTPARCHRTNRRQQVVPDPQPISCGNMFQGMRSTNRMPVRTARSGIGVRPAYRRRRDRRFGSKGSMRCHNSSSSKDLVMPDRLPVGCVTVPRRDQKYKL
jgi:hypothetical protein